MVIVDSSVWIDFLNGHVNPQTDWLEAAILSGEELGLTSLILCEVRQGVRIESQSRDFSHDLMQFPVFDGCDAACAVQAARNYRILRRRASRFARRLIA